MSIKIHLLCFTSAVFVMSASSQCIGFEPTVGPGLARPFGAPWPYEAFSPYETPYGPGWPAAGCACGIGPLGLNTGFAPAAGYGGGLFVNSASPIAPTGLAVESENVIEGFVAVVGQLPFLGAVATDGIFSTAGAGAVSYGCGDGAVGIVAEAPIAPAAISPAYGFGGPIGGVPYNGFGGPLGYGNCGGFGPIY